jgi:UDP-glucose 4-epimerase
VLDGEELALILRARSLAVPSSLLRAAVAASWRVHLQPTPPGWVDLALAVPLMDCARAQSELAFSPRRSAGEALLELMDGLRSGAGAPTPPLEPDAGGRLRWRELASAVGAGEWIAAR